MDKFWSVLSSLPTHFGVGSGRTVANDIWECFLADKQSDGSTAFFTSSDITTPGNKMFANLTTGAGLYIPQNYDHAFKGPVSLRTALASSLNVPAVRTLVMVTPERFAQRLAELGLPLKHNGDYYGYSLALGSAEVSLATLANAYRALANGGLASPWRVLGSEPVVVARCDQLDVPGFVVYVAATALESVSNLLLERGAAPASAEAIEAARIEAGYPLYGRDMNDDVIPLEAGIEGRAISFTKGCYVGQEVVIRIMHRGHGRVARKLVAFRIDGELPSPGTTLLVGGNDVGFVTSAARSPRFGPIALGYVHRDHAEPGSRVDVAGTPAATGTVTATPMS